MFTTGYITGGGVRPQHKREVSQDRTSQLFVLFRYKDDSEEDAEEDVMMVIKMVKMGYVGGLMMRRMVVTT